MIRFVKYQALGNDYLVIEPDQLNSSPSSEQIRQICDRHYGVGADGVLFGPLTDLETDFAVRIFNPDGSEAEKSGNGLRILARYLLDTGRVETMADGRSRQFSIRTAVGPVRFQVLDYGKLIKIEMGRAEFLGESRFTAGRKTTSALEQIHIENEVFQCIFMKLGNPHCVVINKLVDREELERIGPRIENDPHFPQRTNVQFLQPIDFDNIRIQIWERGAGITLSSGSSSCAAAAAAHRLGICGSAVNVHNPGGVLTVTIGLQYDLSLTGPVERVFEGIAFFK